MSLVSSIVFPDLSTYSFQYEQTPNAPLNVTGRLIAVRLPTGGQIQYTYTGGSSGIVCQDGSNAGLTRKLVSGGVTSSTWTYSRPTVTSTTSHTEVVDGLGNHANYDFVLSTGSSVAPNWYETSRNIYQQTESGTPTLSRQTCYNQSTAPCTTTAITPPITQIDTYQTMDGTLENGSTFTYNQYGLLTDEKDYDYAAVGSRGSAIQEQIWTYPSYPNIVDSLSSYEKRLNGNTVLTMSYSYDYWPLVPTSALPQHVSVSGQRGNLCKKVNGVAHTYLTYDDAGQIRTSVDSDGNTTSYTYDTGTDAYLAQVTYPTTAAGVTLTTQSNYDTNTGLILTSTDPNGKVTQYSYDSMLRQTGVTYPDQGQVSTTYNYTGSPATITQGILQVVGGNAITSTDTLDPWARIAGIALTDSAGNDTVAYTYDGNQNLATVTNLYRTTSDSTYGVTTYSYDSLGRTTGVTEPDTSTMSYNNSANTETVTDEAQKKRKLIFDGLGRLSQTQEPDGTGAFNYITTYAYGQNYQYSTRTYQTVVQQNGGDPNPSNWRQRTFTFDGLGRLAQESTPEAGTTSWSFSPLCSGDPTLPCTRTDARGVITTYSYDALNRLGGKSYNTAGTTAAATPSVTYFYDQPTYNGLTITNGLGQQTGMSDGSGQTAWGYDSMGRATNIKRTINGVTKSAVYTYNADGTAHSIQDFGGSNSTVTYAYNNTGLPVSAIDSGHGLNFVTSGGYAAPGLLTGMVQGYTSGFTGITSSNQFNNRLQPSALLATTPPSTKVFSLTYGYGTSGYDNGNIQQITDGVNSAHSATFAYDQLNRLTTAQAGSTWGDTYVYDPWGNLLQKTQVSGTAQGENLSISVNGNNKVLGLGYDLAGNVTTDNIPNTYTYDAEGRIATVSGYTYTYDGNGLRVKKSSTSVNRLYWPGTNGQTLNESDLSGGSVVRNVYFNGGLVARVDASGNVHYPLEDHLGSTRVVLSASGQVQDQIDYYPFGTILNYSTQSSGDLYTFTGYESDTESSSYHSWFRNQSPSLGRFLSSDPYDGSYDEANPQSLSRYAYVLNGPLSYVDPLGLVPMCYQVFDIDDEEHVVQEYWECSGGWGGGGAGEMIFGGGGHGGGGGGAAPGNGPAQNNDSTSVVCTGFGRGLGNDGHLVPKQGAIPNTTVQLGTAAVIPSQFGLPDNGAAIAPYAPFISGTIGNESFPSVNDVIGGKLINGMTPRAYLQGRFPGLLIVEIYGAADQYNHGKFAVPVEINVPDALGCPTGTSPAYGDPIVPPPGSPVPAVARRIK